MSLFYVSLSVSLRKIRLPCILQIYYRMLTTDASTEALDEMYQLAGNEYVEEALSLDPTDNVCVFVINPKHF